MATGVAQDAQEAASLFKQAAKAGNNEARFHLGVMHLNGHGVQKNIDVAQQHLHEAATVRPLSPLPCCCCCCGHHNEVCRIRRKEPRLPPSVPLFLSPVRPQQKYFVVPRFHRVDAVRRETIRWRCTRWRTSF